MRVPKVSLKIDIPIFLNSDVDQMMMSGLSTPQFSKNTIVMDIACV